MPKIVKVPHPSRVLCQRMGLLTRSRSNAPCGDSRLGCRRKLHEPGVYKKLSTPIASCHFLTNGHCHWGVYPRDATVAPPSRPPRQQQHRNRRFQFSLCGRGRGCPFGKLREGPRDSRQDAGATRRLRPGSLQRNWFGLQQVRLGTELKQCSETMGSAH